MHNYSEQLSRVLQQYTINGDPADLSRSLQRLLADLHTEFAEEVFMHPVGAIIARRISDLAEGKDRLRIASGFSELDRLAALSAGELVVIGGRPGMGKTTLMVSLALQMARRDQPVLYASLDLGDWQLADRFIAQISGPEKQDVAPDTPPSAENIAASAMRELNSLPVHVASAGLHNIEAVTASIRKAVAGLKVKVIFIDYLQLLGTINKRMNREAELAGITRALKNLAKELSVLVVASSQLSRAVESRPGGSKRPQLSDLRESGAIEQDADKVLFLYRPEYYGLEVDENNEPTAGVMEVIIAKNKNGPTGAFRLQVEPGFTGLRDHVPATLTVPARWTNEPDDA